MYRILAGAQEVRERRAQRRHPAYARPELLATGPNELWSWDISKLRGPAKWTYYQLYVILDTRPRQWPDIQELDSTKPRAPQSLHDSQCGSMVKCADPPGSTSPTRRPVLPPSRARRTSGRTRAARSAHRVAVSTRRSGEHQPRRSPSRRLSRLHRPGVSRRSGRRSSDPCPSRRRSRAADTQSDPGPGRA